MTVVPSPSKVSTFGYPDEFLTLLIRRDLTLRCYALSMLLYLLSAGSFGRFLRRAHFGKFVRQAGGMIETRCRAA